MQTLVAPRYEPGVGVGSAASKLPHNNPNAPSSAAAAGGGPLPHTRSISRGGAAAAVATAAAAAASGGAAASDAIGIEDHCLAGMVVQLQVWG